MDKQKLNEKTEKANLKNKLFISLIILLSSLYVISLVLSLLGVGNFSYNGDKEIYKHWILNTNVFQISLTIFLYNVNLILLLGIAKAIKIKDVLKQHWRFLAILSIIVTVIPKEVGTYHLLGVILIVATEKTVNYKPVLFFALSILLMGLYQPLLMLIRLGYIPDFGELTLFQELEFDIDQYVFISIIYIYILHRKKVKNYENLKEQG